MSDSPHTLDDSGFDLLFVEAHTSYGWQAKEVPLLLIQRAFERARMGPTSVNCQPMRLVLVQSADAKERLKPSLSGTNVEKTMAAPVTAIIAMDTQFYEHLPQLMPAMNAKPMFESSPAFAEETAFRNSTLQGAYLMIALRGVGLDVGPMSGFDKAKVDQAFFPDGRFKSNWLVNIGYGDPAKMRPRSPRFEFDQIAVVV